MVSLQPIDPRGNALTQGRCGPTFWSGPVPLPRKRAALIVGSTSIGM